VATVWCTHAGARARTPASCLSAVVLPELSRPSIRMRCSDGPLFSVLSKLRRPLQVSQGVVQRGQSSAVPVAHSRRAPQQTRAATFSNDSVLDNGRRGCEAKV